jgi:hypothetical protein
MGSDLVLTILRFNCLMNSSKAPIGNALVWISLVPPMNGPVHYQESTAFSSRLSPSHGY